MSNLLEQAISADDGGRAAKIIQQALGSTPMTSSTTFSRKRGQPIANSGRVSSANGGRPRHAS
jgi:hypothetical protein